MSPEEAVEIFGTEIPFTYYNGSEYVQSVFYYDSSGTAGHVYSEDSYTSVYDGAPLLFYTASASIASDPSFLQVDIQPTFGIFDTDRLYTFIGCMSNSSVSDAAYDSPAWDWMIGGKRHNFYNTDYTSSGSGSFAYFERFFRNGVRNFVFVPVEWTGSDLTSAYSLRATFSGVTDQYGFVALAIGCPYVSADAYGALGAVPDGDKPGTGSGDVNVTVDVDMSETNGLLGTLIDAVLSLGSFIINGISGLFLPSDEALNAFFIAVDDLLRETFGSLYDAENLTQQAFDQLLTGSAIQTLTFPAIEVAGYHISSQKTVSLKPYASDFSLLYSSLEIIIDIVCTLGVLNMLGHKFDAIIHGKQIVEVE